MENEAEDLNIPAHAQSAKDVILPANSAERKRVLNILAQRRYRRRRREKQATLELLVSRVNEQTTPTRDSIARPMQRAETEADSITTDSSPGSEDSLVPSDMMVPYENGSTWWPSNDSDCNVDFAALFGDCTWSSDNAVPALNDIFQSEELQNTTFADDFHIAVPELDLLRAAYEVAGRLQSSHLLFAGLQARSIFHTVDCSRWITTLPKNLQPTTEQLTIPHHPLIDILPWPAVRARLVRMYSLPSDLWPRHPSDGTESSLVRLVYDMEDGGIRVTGPDPSDESAWEVEQRFFEIWWWALDQSVISNSDRKRRIRGLPKLSSENISAG